MQWIQNSWPLLVGVWLANLSQGNKSALISNLGINTTLNPYKKNQLPIKMLIMELAGCDPDLASKLMASFVGWLANLS